MSPPVLRLDDESLALPAHYEAVAEKVLIAAKEVIRELGPGMRENIYRQALAIALTDMGLGVKQEAPVEVVFRGHRLGKGYSVDVLVAGCVVVETKSVAELHPAVESQILTYMRGAKSPLGFVINFGAPPGRRWIFRKVLSEYAQAE